GSARLDVDKGDGAQLAGGARVHLAETIEDDEVDGAPDEPGVGQVEREGAQKGSELLGDPPPEHALAPSGCLGPHRFLLGLPPVVEERLRPALHAPAQQAVARPRAHEHPEDESDHIHFGQTLTRRCNTHPAPDWSSATREDPVTAVRKVAAADVPQVAAALGRAFHDDPVISWFLPDESRRSERAARWFSVQMARFVLQQGYCYTTDDTVGAALWAPPGKWLVSMGDQLRILPQLIGIFGRRLGAGFRAFNLIEKHHPRNP